MYKRGYFVLLVLVFSAVFFTLISALAGYIFVEKRAQIAKENREKALHIAEAGLEYYKWRLAHYPDDLTDGTGGAGPYVHALADPEGGTLGTYSIEVTGEEFCDTIAGVVIRSTGWTEAAPMYRRVVEARYARPSVAEFSTIVDANVWAGPDRVITGPYHGNGGVRMDGTHNADVTSGVGTWQCTSSFGCTPTATKDGVFGAGSSPELWDFPAPPVNFGGLSVNLYALKGYATSSGGVYLADQANDYGYHITFKNDGTFDARRVTATTQVWGYTSEFSWQQERPVIATEAAAVNYNIPDDCPVVFVEDNVWVDGTLSGQAVLASGNFTNPGKTIIVNGDLTYANAEGDGLTAIGENNVLVGLKTPATMIMRGVFIAENGRFGRNHYCTGNCSTHSGDEGLPSSLDQYVTRTLLTTVGTVVSKGRVGTKWTSGNPPSFVSGYSSRIDTYDANLATDPPPFTPWISDDYTLTEWREVN